MHDTIGFVEYGADSNLCPAFTIRWHICSSCQKAAHYMCYTCTYSLCKGCVKDADYFNVRGNNGLCGTCMRTVMLIENVQENKEMAQVDFDDRSSWEYLFKVYWMFLKGKVSLTLDELTRAKNPWKGTDTIACKRDSSGELQNKGNDDKGSSFQNYCAGLEKNNSNKRKAKKQPILSKKDSLTLEISDIVKELHPLEGTRWASKELLEFVAHMRNGDTSVLSEFDVQALLQEYIKKKNLRDPHQKCQIVCDSRLINLFGKKRVGHFEMLKLLESHFLIKDGSSAEDIFRVGVVNAIASQVEADGNYCNQLPKGRDKRRKACKKVGERGSPTNLDAFAAIDVHNINLIYLRRNLMESLMDDADKFHEKVVGSIVRIRILNDDQKQEIYRLVQVVGIGTSKVAEPYKLGERSTDAMLEILNLDKKEAIAIDEISNQEFSEDECKRLCQRIKCGLFKRLTVKIGCLSSIPLPCCTLRECVEKLELLNSLEERQRRLSEITEVHTDPKMDPSFKSKDNAGELDEKKRDDNLGTKLSGRGRKRREPIPAQKGVCVVDNSRSRAKKNFPKSSEKNRKFGITSTPDKGGAIRLHERINESSLNQERESSGITWNTPVNLVPASGSLAVGWNSQAVVSSEMFGGVAPEVSQLALSIRTEESANTLETDKLWHYQDPNGKVQGPFSMLQLRKWNTAGHFPSDLRIWKINDKAKNPILAD
ncbi:Zinc finger CCCH domain-containing protein 19 [Morella rubra]|uniref:Zinc finger CCCH domain-containing protein 19 n=1 Tax=Morella rubra TaxID=262757 RepID=A0A6A1VUR0_9ROSI|nr:Zinc finger CCCH domain-containing protein 19 [Morella rubra]